MLYFIHLRRFFLMSEYGRFSPLLLPLLYDSSIHPFIYPFFHHFIVIISSPFFLLYYFPFFRTLGQEGGK